MAMQATEHEQTPPPAEKSWFSKKVSGFVRHEIDCDQYYPKPVHSIVIAICKGDQAAVNTYLNDQHDLFTNYFIQDHNLGTLLHIAIVHEQIEIARRLLKEDDQLLNSSAKLRMTHGAIGNRVLSMTPLQFSLWLKRTEMTMVLMEFNATLDDNDNGRESDFFKKQFDKVSVARAKRIKKRLKTQ